MHPMIPALLAAGFLGCASANVLRLDQIARPPNLPDSVTLLLEEPTQPYSSIALIEVSDQGWGMNLEALRKRLSREAAKLGADAVIVGHQTAEGGTIIVPVGNSWYAGALKETKLVAKAIVFTKPD